MAEEPDPTAAPPSDGVGPIEAMKKRLEDLAYMHDMLGLPGETLSPESGAPAGDETLDAGGGSWGGADARPQGSVPGYELLSELGRGGMGVVYKARQINLKRQVALKMILAAAHVRPEQHDRFRAEAEAVAQLQHPHIVQIFEIGEHDRNPYFSMEYVPGGSLSQRLREGPLLGLAAAKLLETLARAVQYAHQQGVIHRDLKPANVLLTADGVPKITDFGLAKRIDDADLGRTRSGDVLGTPSYMAPEQAEGKVAQVGPHSDVYALGAILYETLTGRPPFKAESLMTTLHQVIHEEPVPPSRLQPGLDRDLETICLKALAKDPEQRYRSALALAQDLERFQAGEPILARRLGALPRLWRRIKRRPLVVGAVLGCVVAVLAAILGFHQASVTQRRTELTREFDEGLAQAEWSTQRADRLEELLTSWSQWDQDQSAAARKRLEDRFVELFRGALQAPRLENAKAARLEEDLQWLQARNPHLADALKQDLNRRMRDWETVFDLKAPWLERDKVFAAGQAVAKGDVLQRTDGEPKPVATMVSSEGKVQLDAVFDANWEDSSRLGLYVQLGNVPDGEPTGYAFRITAVATKSEAWGQKKPGGPAPTFRGAGRGGRLEILRHGVVLRTRDVALANGVLTLNVRCEQDRLQFQVNADEPLVFVDPVPIRRQNGAVFGIDWPGGVGLRQLRAVRLTLPGVPSRLERGDSLFDEERFSDALTAYQEQAIQATAAEIRGEANCKAGLCLLSLKRLDDAAVVLEPLAVQGDDRWSLLAACHLWALRLRQQRLDDAQALFVSIRGRFKAEHLAMFVPEATKRQFHTENILARSEMLFPTVQMRQRAEAFLQLADLLGDPGMLWSARYDLARLDAGLGNAPRAQTLTAEMLPAALRIGVIHHGGNNLIWTARLHGWMARQAGGAPFALEEIQRYLKDFREALAQLHPYDAVRRYSYAALHLELARLQVSLGQWDPAEKQVDEFLRLQGEHALSQYDALAAARLMKGYMHQRRGEKDLALQVWKRGLYPAYCAEQPPQRRPSAPMPPGGDGLLYYSILASLTGELTDDQAEALWQGLASFWVGDSFFGQVGAALKPAPAVLRGMWSNTKNAQDSARRLAFLDLTFLDYYRLPLVAAISEKFRHDAFDSKTTAEQEDLVWRVGAMALDHFHQGHMQKAHVLQLGLAWKGTTNFLGWGGVAPSLKVELRGPAAYVLGHRYLKLGRPADARMFFNTALKDAADVSSLQRLGRQALAALPQDK